LLLESTVTRPFANKVLLTIDLTPSVAEEAFQKDSNIGVIVAYHPTIFRGLKSLTLNDPLQEIILKCAATGIRFVYHIPFNPNALAEKGMLAK
jgi:putative NIF3 family GTP cyclohydrolase 1 type 2